ncbi:MAG: putative selenium metabolism protein SsnA [Symbiobacteriaceae bacterium]|jgi:putative selenium metabolism protein SsnA|nr:putative selenium metabolism protein SsnA [Symbiobacteriaceae bacterium]
MKRLIGPGAVATMTASGVIHSGGVLVEGDRITAVAAYDELAELYPDAERLDARGAVIMPGLTNAHTHLYGLFARGFAFGASPASFRQILEQVWWRLDKALAREAVHLSALCGLADHLRCGVTTIVDHHASPSYIEGSLDEIADAAEHLGIRACLCYEVTDRNGPAGAAAGIAENVRYLKARRTPALFGLHASFTLSDETLAAARRTADDLGASFHIHLAEGPEDPAHALIHSGQRTAHRLAKAGILRPGTFVGHGVHLDEEEAAILAYTGATLTHQPHSNMGNAVGFPRILHMRERGVKVALGTDGYTPDMLETLRAAATLHSHATVTPSAGVGEFANVLLKENPSLLSTVFQQPIGRLEPNAAADLIITDYHPPTPMTADNFPFHLYFGISSAHIRTVIVGGRIAVLDHRLVGLDEEALSRQAQHVAGQVWKQI